jgi:PAS domain S-box-containing protein
MLSSDGLVTSWNAGAERLKRYRPAEIIGQPYERFFTREDQQHNVPANILAMAKDAGHNESEGWRVRKDGTRFWGSATLHKIQDKSGRHIGFAQVINQSTSRVGFSLTWRLSHDSRSTCKKTMRVNWTTQPWKHFGYARCEACKTAKAPRMSRAHYGSLRARCIDGWRSTVVVDGAR